MKPKYKHDCDACIFLGHYNNADLYVCPDGETILARVSDDPSNYVSGFSFRHSNPLLKEAYTRALTLRHNLNEILLFKNLPS